MDATTAFVMALLALLVALGGLTISLLTYVRGRPPKPKWDIRWSSDGDDPRREILTDSVCLIASNMGKGVARDVKLRLIQADGKPMTTVLDQQEELEFGQGAHKWFTFSKAAARDGGSSAMVHARKAGHQVFFKSQGAVGAVKVELTWRTDPHLHKLRRRVLSYTHKAK